MWTGGTILPETATVWGSPATLTWGKLNLRIVKYYRGCLFVLYNTGVPCTLFVSSSVGEGK